MTTMGEQPDDPKVLRREILAMLLFYTLHEARLGMVAT